MITSPFLISAQPKATQISPNDESTLDTSIIPTLATLSTDSKGLIFSGCFSGLSKEIICVIPFFSSLKTYDSISLTSPFFAILLARFSEPTKATLSTGTNIRIAIPC